MPPSKFREEILSGSIPRYLIHHSLMLWPGLAGLSLLALVDAWFIGRLGPASLSAVGFCVPVFLIGLSVVMSLGTGITAVISRLIGGQNHGQLGNAQSQATMLALAGGTLSAAMGWLSHNWVFELLNAPPELRPEIDGYMNWVYWGFVVLGLMIGLASVIRAWGNTRLPAAAMITVVAINFGLDPILIFGVGSFEGLGMPGAALATLLALTTGLLVLVIPPSGRSALALSRYMFSGLGELWKKILAIALPVALTRTLLPAVAAAVTGFLAAFSPGWVGAFGLGYRLDLFVQVWLIALSAVLAPFAGQLLGAMDRERLQRGAYLAIRMSVIYGLIAAGLIILLRSQISGLFTDAPDLQDKLEVYFLLLPAGYPFLAVILLVTALLNALGRSRLAATLGIIHLGAVYLPLAKASSVWLGPEWVIAAYPLANLLLAGPAILLLRSIPEFKKRAEPED